jgi:hypothetical protein
MDITPQEFYAILRQNNVDEARANQIVEEHIQDNGLVSGKLGVDEFTLADNENFQDLKNSGDSGPRDLQNLTDIFGDDEKEVEGPKTIGEALDEVGQRLIDKMQEQINDMFKLAEENPEFDPFQAMEDQGVNPELLEQLRQATNGGTNLDPGNIDDFIRRLKRTKLDQIENKDRLNYLAANNAMIHDSMKLAASAR